MDAQGQSAQMKSDADIYFDYLHQTVKDSSMKIEVNERGVIRLQQVFIGVEMKTNAGEKLFVCMRDSGYELNYQGQKFRAVDNVLKPMEEETKVHEAHHVDTKPVVVIPVAKIKSMIQQKNKDISISEGFGDKIRAGIETHERRLLESLLENYIQCRTQ